MSMVNTNLKWRFEYEPYDEPPDETSYCLRGYLDEMSDDKIQQYDSTWSNEKVIEWDGNFKSEGDMLLATAEREIYIEEYRKELEACIAYRNKIR